VVCSSWRGRPSNGLLFLELDWIDEVGEKFRRESGPFICSWPNSCGEVLSSTTRIKAMSLLLKAFKKEILGVGLRD